MQLDKKIARFANWSLKGLKVMDTSDGYAYTAKVLEGGREVGSVEQGGYGGPTMVLLTPDAKARLNAHCATLPKLTGYGMELDIDEEIFFDELQAHTETLKTIRRQAKGKTLFSLATHKDNEYCVLSVEYSPAVRTKLEAKYGASNVCIFNELI